MPFVFSRHICLNRKIHKHQAQNKKLDFSYNGKTKDHKSHLMSATCFFCFAVVLQMLSAALLFSFFFKCIVRASSNLYSLGRCNFQSWRINWDEDTVRDCSGRCQQSQMSQVSLSPSWHFQCGGLMENYIVSFPKHFHYCNKGSVCFADTLARERRQKGIGSSCVEEIQSACLHRRICT